MIMWTWNVALWKHDVRRELQQRLYVFVCVLQEQRKLQRSFITAVFVFFVSHSIHALQTIVTDTYYDM